MANSQNLIPGGHKLTLEEQKAGGKKSVESRRKKKAVREALQDLISQPCKSNKMFKQMAAKMGLPEEISIEELFTAISVFNSAKNANLGELGKLMALLGEFSDGTDEQEQKPEDDPLTKALKEEAERMNNEQ